MFKVEVIADDSGTWCGNALTFETREQAEAYARDLYSRWLAVREWRVVDVDARIEETRAELSRGYDRIDRATHRSKGN